MERYNIGTIRSDRDSYQTLIDFYSQTKDLFLEDIILDFSRTGWFDANLSAVLGAILYNLKEDFNDVYFENMHSGTENILKRNLFLSYYGESSLADGYNTTIKYHRFRSNEEKLFSNYLDEELHSKLPDTIPDKLKKKIIESIFEIFNNAVIHSNCDNIFACGQYYHNKNLLKFTIVDIGETIQKKVNDFTDDDLSSVEAIEWSLQSGNTTRQGNIPGGIGLKLIREFMRNNKGKIQIISSDGFWQEYNGRERKHLFTCKFDGTIVNLEFNTDDDCSYMFQEPSITLDDIF